LLTAGVVMPNSRAAALKLPALASVEKNPRSAGWMPLVMRASVHQGAMNTIVESG
jgi:hypothetical protein